MFSNHKIRHGKGLAVALGSALLPVPATDLAARPGVLSNGLDPDVGTLYNRRLQCVATGSNELRSGRWAHLELRSCVYLR